MSRVSWRFVVLLIVGFSLLTDRATAQGRGDREGGRGDRGRGEGGRGEGGRGDRGGGFPGGGFGGGGFPGGGFPGGGFPGGGFGGGGFGGGGFGGGGFNPTDMLRRLDENNNGMIDPSESSGRARFMLERFARDIPGIDLSKPIPIDRLSRGLEQLRGGRPGGSPDSDANAGSSGNSPGSRSTVEEPLVPGFGVNDGFAPPPGFGTRAEAGAVKVSDADLREAEDRMRRYDQNQDGFLDREEVSRNRWSDDPFVYDQNRDGRISAKELAMRYAKRRGTESVSGTPSGSRSPGSSFPAFAQSSSAPSGGDSRTDTMMRFMMERYDTNRSGVIEKEEWGNFRSDPSAFDTNKDGNLTREELAAYLQSRMSGGGGGPGGGFGGPGGGFGGAGGGDGGRRDRGEGRDRGESSSSAFYPRRSEAASSSAAAPANSTAAKKSDRKSYRALSPTERLPKGLVEWFARSDANADGQVAMAEFSASWSSTTARDFAQFDLNGDGLITAQECLQATDKGIVRGSSATASSSGTSASTAVASASPSTASLSSTTSSSTNSASGAVDSTQPAAKVAAPVADVKIDSKTLAYFQGVVKKYDKNGDGTLTKDEWSSMSKDPSSADKDNDGKITPTEYAIFSVTK